MFHCAGGSGAGGFAGGLLTSGTGVAYGWMPNVNNIFWLIGVIVVVLAVLGFLGLR